jgi:hypothetical protein
VNVLWHSTGFPSGLSFFVSSVYLLVRVTIVVSAGKLRKLWKSPSELRGSLCERRLEWAVLRPALLPVKTAQVTQFFRQVRRHTVKSLSLTECVQGALRRTKLLNYTSLTHGGYLSLR